MKKFILLLFLIASSGLAFSQNTVVVGALYKFISPMKLPSCDENGNTATPAQYQSVAINWQFTIEKVVTSGIIIAFPQWPTPTGDKGKDGNLINAVKIAKMQINAKLNTDYRNSQGPQSAKYYLISTADLQNNAVRLQHGGTVSLVTGSTFIKFRPGSTIPIINSGQDYYKNTDISNDFTISLLASIKLSPAGSNSDIFALFGANFSSIKVTPATTQGFLASETNIGSMAPTIGFVYQIDKVQFGILSGLDILTGDVNRYWVYRGRPWFGIGIGYSIVSAFGTSSDNTNK